MTPIQHRGGSVPSEWNVNIDQYINPFLLSPRQQCFPPVIRRFIGNRDQPPRPLGNVFAVIWCFIGTLAALSLVFAVSKQIPGLESRDAPLILGSFGAAAVLEFYAIDSPLSQPRNTMLGQLGGSVIGVGISKGFARISPPSRYSELRWFAGTLSCACSTVFMGLTGTVHPPAGATALLAVTDDGVAQLGWVLVPVVVLSSSLVLVVALLVNNVQRVFPKYWWTADEVGSFWMHGRDGSRDPGAEAGTVAAAKGCRDRDVDEELGKVSSDEAEALVTITKHEVFVSPDVRLSAQERICLENIFQTLAAESPNAPPASPEAS